MHQTLKLKVRKMDVSDIRFVSEHESDKQGLSYQSLSEEYLYHNLAQYFIAVVEGERIGYIGLWMIKPNAEITTLYVLEEYRGKGYGEALLDKGLHHCLKEKIVDITLEVNVHNKAAIRLYEKKGFRMVAKRKNYYQNGDDAFLMLKTFGSETHDCTQC